MGSEILQAAIKYAQAGFAVFPVNREKRPYTPHGCKDAKTDPTVIKEWWRRWPDANVAIATGSISKNLIVVDLDVDDDKGINGYHSLCDWEKINGLLPETWQCITGRGGYHLYFIHPNAKEITNRTGLLEGVDIRGEGGYVIAPPSVHKNGALYEWEQSPDEFDIAEADETLNQLLATGKKQSSGSFVVPDVIPSGKRNDTLFKMATSLQERGYADEAILQAVMAQNEATCEVPLERDEVQRIVESAVQYKKGELKELQEFIGESWHEPVFDTYLDKNGDEKVKQTIKNMEEAIEYDKELWGRIRYNVLAYAPYVYGNLPWMHDKENARRCREWLNSDDSHLKSYIESKYGFKSMDKIMEALKNVANRHRYNPVVDLLESCYERYDGKKHIENLLPDFLGAQKTPYTTGVMTIVMLGAISRAYRPGCKFDYTAIWVGGQGIGKSTLTRYLALADDWFNDNFNTLDGDKAAEKLRGMWIVELAELLATKKAKEVESIKAFLTSTTDNYRPPYERRTERRPRSCIFIGTTNSTQFLTDRTGNRRFLPVELDASSVKRSLFDNEAEVKAEFVQAWGEAMKIFKDHNEKPSLILSAELQREALKMQERFLEEDPRIGLIQNFLDQCDKPRVCVSMLAKEALRRQDEPNRLESNQLHEIMENYIAGWERLRNESNGRGRCGEYGVQICYVRAGTQSARISVPEDFEPAEDDDIFT